MREVETRVVLGIREYFMVAVWLGTFLEFIDKGNPPLPRVESREMSDALTSGIRKLSVAFPVPDELIFGREGVNGEEDEGGG